MELTLWRSQGVGLYCMTLQRSNAQLSVREHSTASLPEMCVAAREQTLPLTSHFNWDKVSLLFALVCANLVGPQASGESPISVGILEPQTCTDIPSFTWLLGIWTWVLRLAWANSLVSELRRESFLCAWGWPTNTWRSADTSICIVLNSYQK